MEAHARASATQAPWAEIGPTPGFVRVEDLLSLPDDGWRYEAVEGVLVRIVGSGDEAAIIAGTIYVALRLYMCNHSGWAS